MLIRPKHIHNFYLLHAYIASLLHVFIQVLYHFKSFFWTNLLTRCPVPVHVFCLSLVSEKVTHEKSSKKFQKFTKIISRRRAQEPEGQPRGATRGSKRPPTQPRWGPRLGGAPSPRVAPGTDLLPYLFLRPRNAKSATLFQKLDPRHRHHQKP
jgi:hypothetical protein